jgi:hypothetical protein
LHGFTVTADRGYAKMSLIKQLVDYDIGFVLIMPEHLLECHPFVGKSYLRVGWDDEESESGGDRAQTGTTSEASEEEINSTEAAILSSPTVRLDRSRPLLSLMTQTLALHLSSAPSHFKGTGIIPGPKLQLLRYVSMGL